MIHRRFLHLAIALGFALFAAAGPGLHAQEAKPKTKDTSARIWPKEAEFRVAVTPAEAKAGETVTYSVTATLHPGFHIYAYAPSQALDEPGPRKTLFDLFDPAGLKPAGSWTPAQPPHREKDPNFPELPFVEYHEGEVTWNLKLLVPPGTEPGTKSLRNQIRFQICNANGCKNPVYRTLPEATLTVLPGGAPAPDPAVAAAEPPAAEPPPADTTPAAASEATTEGTANAAAATAGGSEVERKINQGLIPFLLFSALGGVFALIMPCVWPMVPVTVNFFVKQGQSGRGNTTRLAVTYCLAIIVIFTLVGVLFSAIFGAASLQRLANTAWLNLTVAVIFLIFGLNLLGLFELRLPNFLLNASAQGEARGGLVGVIFMALTLTITSFTCTFPVVGGLLVVAAGGQYFYPVLGLATFATVLALPFFLLALAPGLIQRVPRSGDWMNAVKVVGGLVEIGAAFKFLNTAEIALGATPEDAWFDAQLVLAAWVVLAAVCGLYLLGLFRTDHDHDSVKVGPMRILTGSLFLFFALYMSPALFGYPPQSRLYNLFVGLMPADVGELSQARAVSSGGAAESGEVKATSTDPKVAVREEKKFHGVQWGMSYEAALEEARATGRPVLIDFTGVNCANCRQMEREVMPRSEIRELLGQFVTVALYTDFVPIRSITPDERFQLARDNQEFQVDLVRDNTTPLYVIVRPSGEVVDARGGYIPWPQFQSFLSEALNRARTPTPAVAAK